MNLRTAFQSVISIVVFNKLLSHSEYLSRKVALFHIILQICKEEKLMDQDHSQNLICYLQGISVSLNFMTIHYICGATLLQNTYIPEPETSPDLFNGGNKVITR